jgi:hypothetical protein
MKPKIFIGSSTEGLDVARAIEFQLDRAAEITVWSDCVFGLGRGSLESLVIALYQFDFAVLVLTDDDMVISRDSTSQSPRDNVLFELGLFIGRLGRERTFIVYNRDKNLKLPSDLNGVSMADYGNRQDGNLIAALGPPCTKIRYAINCLGTFSSNVPAKFPPEREGELFGRSATVIALLSEGQPVNPLLVKVLIALLKCESKVDTSTIEWSKATAADLRLNELLQMLEHYGTAAVAVLDEDKDFSDKEDLLVLVEELYPTLWKDFKVRKN